MDTGKYITITHDDAAKLISVYYKEQDRDVKARFSSNEDGKTSIQVRETVSLDGMTKTAEREMNFEKLNEIISTIFKRAGRQVTSIINYAAAGSRVSYCGCEHIVKPEEEKRLIVTLKPAQKYVVR